MGPDWTQAILAGVTAALLAGLTITLRMLYRTFSPRLGKRGALALISVVALGVVVAALWSPFGTRMQEWAAERHGAARLGRAMTENMKPLLETPEFRARIQGMGTEEARTLGAQLSSQGLLALPDEDLILRAQLLHDAISRADEEVCAAQLLGPSAEQAQRMLAQLPDESLQRWAALSARAMEASLRGDPRQVPDAEQVQQAFLLLISAMPEEDGVLLGHALSNPTSLNHQQACLAVRALYGTVVKLPLDAQAQIARVLAVQ